ncbi:MAG TPA: hypothetical protein VFJ97_13860 [Dermatophilaceae bacterium]|nr:hypothetical protein [Dermatophilaceae bacterium]
MLSTCESAPAFDGVATTMTDPAELNRLTALASSEGEALAALDGCVARLHQVQAARSALAGLDASSLRAALTARREALGEDPQ